jgi:hypothetical protein
MKKQPNQRPMKRNPPKPAANAPDEVEEKLVAFAQQLGFMVGTVQAKAEGWLDRETLTKQIGRIRDSASDLLAHVTPASAAPTADAAPARVNRGPVDAPRKRHRRPPPQERLAKRMGEPMGKQMGQKSAKGGHRRGRG